MNEPIVPEELPQNPMITAALDALAKAYDMPTRQEAHEKNIFVICKKEVTREMYASWSRAGQKEYVVSGFCEPCFDKLLGEDE